MARNVNTDPIQNLESIDVSCIIINEKTRFNHVISNAFSQLMDKEPFACIPNIDRNLVWYILEGKLCRSSINTFVDVWMRHVFFAKVIPHLKRTWDRWESYSSTALSSWLEWSTDNIIRQGEWILIKNTEMYRVSRDSILGHLSRISKKERTLMRLRMSMIPESTGDVVVDLLGPEK
jgi:hypothetical protein